METNIRLVKEFSQGINALRHSDNSKAVFYFRVAMNKHKNDQAARALCMAYLGLCEVMAGMHERIAIIEEAHRMSPGDTRILKVLAFTHLHLGQRQKGLATIILGLKIEPHNQDLFMFLKQVGYRQKNIIPSLERSNKLNQMLGRFFRRRNSQSVSMDTVLPKAA